MQISNKQDLRAIELACNSARLHHYLKKVEAAKAMDPFYPERELLNTFDFHKRMEDRYQKLAKAAAQQQEILEVHEKAAS